MEREFPALKVRMFGRIVILYDGEAVPFGEKGMTRVQRLLMILCHSGSGGIVRNKLLEDLYGRDEVADAANNLRVTVHRLKKRILDAGFPEYDYVTIKSGVYYWNCPMKLEVDALEFRRLVTQADGTADRDRKAELLQEACELYKGEFLQELSGEEWVMVEAMQYKKLFEASLFWLCEYLKEHEDYEEILRLSGRAARIYPFDEWQAVKIDCYIAMNRYKEAFKEYKDTEKLFFEELGITPSERMMKQLKSISGHVKRKPEVIREIKDKLLSETGRYDGAYYCSLPSFRDEYIFACRIMERTDPCMYLMMCTITDDKGRPQEDKETLDIMSEKLREAIKESLRRCDTFTRFSSSQFLILLVGTAGENCDLIFDRIIERFSEENKLWKNYIHFDAFPVAEMNDSSRESRGRAAG